MIHAKIDEEAKTSRIVPNVNIMNKIDKHRLESGAPLCRLYSQMVVLKMLQRQIHF